MKGYDVLLHLCLFKLIMSLRIDLKPSRIHLQNVSYFNPSFLPPVLVNIPLIEVCFGTPGNQCLELIMDVSQGLTVIPKASPVAIYKNQFDPNASSTYKQMYDEITDYDTTVSDGLQGYYSTDAISFKRIPNPTKDLFNFMLITKYPARQIDEYDGSLSLSFKPKIHRSYCFIDYLKNLTLITHKNFIMNYYDDGTGHVIFGESNTSALSEYKTCDRLTSEPMWQCKLDKVTMGNKTIEPNINLMFTTHEPYVLGGLDSDGPAIQKYIVDLSKGKCVIINDQQHDYLICDEDVKVDEFPDLVIKFKGELELVFQWKNLFKLTNLYGPKKKLQNKKYVSSYIVSDFPMWMIGLPGMSGNSVLYDIDNDKVGFKPLINLRETESNGVKTICMYLLIFLFVGIVVLSIINNRKEETK